MKNPCNTCKNKKTCTPEQRYACPDRKSYVFEKLDKKYAREVCKRGW